MRILDQHKIHYEVHQYDIDDGRIDGVSVAQKCGEDVKRVYKTLVCVGSDKNYYVFVIPVACSLHLKSCAALLQIKSIEMLPQKQLLPLTGYVHGGCSPIGMKKWFKTFIHLSCLDQQTIYVSGGKIGIQVELSPQDLVAITKGEVANLCLEES